MIKNKKLLKLASNNVFMSKDTREMKATIDENKQKIKDLVAENKVDEADALMNDTEKLQKIYNKLIALEDDEIDNINNQINNGKAKKINKIENKVVYNGELFCKAIADAALRQKGQKGLDLTDEQRMAITEFVDEDGGYAVPEDISVKINKRLKDYTDISNLVSYEKVYTRSGQRTYEKRQTQTALGKLGEYDAAKQSYGTISGTDTPKLERISFKLVDFAGIMTIPNDILKFGGPDLEGYIIDWLVDKVRVTRNTLILEGDSDDNIDGIFSESSGFTVVELAAKSSIKDFKKLLNVTLPNVFKPTSKWIVNQDGFNFLDSLEDAMGRPYLQPDPKEPTKYKFLGKQVIEIPNEILVTKEGKSPIIVGDLKEAYKRFDDASYQLATTNIGAGAFETNTTKTRVIMKFDGSIIDENSIVIANLTLPTEV
jgi:HK97 family phage major capsid protein|nr:MAG TPA: major capsid protein [Caudoviricetes sp.]